MPAEGTVMQSWTAQPVPSRLASLQVLWLPVIAGFMSGWAGINAFSVAPRLVSAVGGSLLALVCWCACHVSTLAIQRLTGGRLPLVPLLALGVLVSGVFMIPGYYAVYELFHQFGWATKGWAAIHDYSFNKGLAATPGTMLFWVSFNYMLVRFGVPRFGFGGARPATPRAAPEVPQAALDPIYAKMRPEVRGPILAVQAEAHFIRVHTTRGQDLIHHRFGEAVEALAPVPGERVHRSWWVAADAVDQRASNGTMLRLVNGLEVPIGRTYMMDARRAGMLA
jgi:hypothetical protein